MEPVDSMYPKDTEQLHYERSTALWQVHHIDGVQFVMLAFGPEKAYQKAIEILTIMGKDTHKGKFEWRRLPIVSIRR